MYESEILGSTRTLCIGSARAVPPQRCPVAWLKDESVAINVHHMALCTREIAGRDQ